MTDSRTQVFLVAGARPNFVKVAPLFHEFRSRSAFDVVLVHTGQHYDDALSNSFFRDLRLPPPDISLEVGSGSHAVQTARVLERFENALYDRRPDIVVVVGDVNSTVACSLAASKVDFGNGTRPQIAHVEAGLRSFDRTMPEEINRIVTDALSDHLFVTEPAGRDNLLREGARGDRIYMVGNVMIDTLCQQLEKARQMRAWERFEVPEDAYAVVTLHRPSNVDDETALDRHMDALERVAQHLPVLFPVHPRTAARLKNRRIDGDIRVLPPLPYLEFLSIVSRARVVLTDSGGIQEETTFLGIPCFTLRDNTERPITVAEGTNVLVGADPRNVPQAVANALVTPMRRKRPPALWDGRAAGRIVDILERVTPKQPEPVLQST